MAVSETLKLILGLAKARELLLLEADTTMPKGAALQRQKMIGTLEKTIANALVATAERLSATPEQDDKIALNAWNYIVHAQTHPEATPFEGSTAYEHLKSVFDDCSNLYQAGDGPLGWMKRTEMLTAPAEKSSLNDAIEATMVFKQRLLAAPEVRAWMEEVRAHKNELSDIDQRNFALMELRWMEAAGLSEELVGKVSATSSESVDKWNDAKKTSDFNAWLPYFEKVVAATQEKAQALGTALDVSPYEALLGASDSSPGLSNDTVNQAFGQLRTELPKLVKEIMAKQQAEGEPLKLPVISMEAREKVKDRLMKDLGLEKEYTARGASTHPCSLGCWKDVRITSYKQDDDLLNDLRAVIHETGHGLYSRALPEEWKDQPVGDYQSLWIHESQALFWDKQVFASMEFMEYLSRVLKEELKVSGPEWEPENLFKLVTRVQPSLIRTRADEVTYPAHVILRHDLEQKLIDGSLQPKDVPEAWNAEMKEMLGVDVPNHAQGCMQDVHWARGALGYFPAYTFGALGAAQLMENLRSEMPDVSEHIRNGEFAPIRQWLTEKIHRHGSLYDGEELIRNATGKPLSADPWLNHIKRRYLDAEIATNASWGQSVPPPRVAGEAPRRTGTGGISGPNG
jgi:carboxypeptidase Taq